ncbi:MAG: hypothetical protein H7Z39_07495 [Burkholderiaceae bacterium]|nr:hypothetical protein [Burkholderiaceae bacterium]
MKLLMMLPLLAALALPLTAPAAEHHHHSAAPHTLELNAGQKWKTDAALRKGMTAIRAAVTGALSAAHGGKATEQTYQAAAQKANVQIAYIVTNCKLDPKADAQLHVVLNEIMSGVETLEGKTAGQQREAGLVATAQALNTYGDHFAHPGWKAIDLGH